MRLEKAYAASQGFALAERLRDELRKPEPLAGAIRGQSLRVKDENDAVRVAGFLDLTHGAVLTRQECHVSAVVPLAPFRFMPSVRYRAYWHPLPTGRQGLGNMDWHINSDGSLCWELPERWRGVLAALEAKLSDDARVDYAAAWFLGSVRSLIYRHLEARRRGLSQWPSEWTQWAHGFEGVEQYRRELSAMRHDPLRSLRPPPERRRPAFSQP